MGRKLTDRRTNETTPVSFIAYSASGTYRAGGFCLEPGAEQDPERKGRRGVNERKGVTRAIGLGQESVLPRDLRISSCGSLLVLFLVDTLASPEGRRRAKESGARGRRAIGVAEEDNAGH